MTTQQTYSYRLVGDHERVFMQYSIGPDFMVTRADPEDREQEEGETPLVLPGDLVVTTKPILHAELQEIPADDTPRRRQRAATAPDTAGPDTVKEG